MAELNSRDRLQPSLLDRLIDDAPQQGKDGVDARVLTRQQLRAAVLRDLSWLFNAIRPEPDADSLRTQERALWGSADLARHSVLNYGMPAYSGVTLSSMNTRNIERSVQQAICDFEPRINPETLSVEVKLTGADGQQNTLQLIIRGQMWSQPVPLELLLSADLDIETGHTSVREIRA
jgi:type VI secretion system protein ImpF